VLKRGARISLDMRSAKEVDALATPEVLEQYFEPQALPALEHPSIDWYLQHALSGALPNLKYARQVIERFGVEALVQTPKVVVGTIHQ